MLWHEHGTDIDNAMLGIPTYVGHVKESDTCWYLSGVPELTGANSGVCAGAASETTPGSRRHTASKPRFTPLRRATPFRAERMSD